MAAVFWSLTSAGVGHGRVRGGMEWFRGDVQWVGARRIELRRRGFAGATSGGGFARCCSLELGSSCIEEEKGGLGRHQKLRGRPRGEERLNVGGLIHRGLTTEQLLLVVSEHLPLWFNVGGLIHKTLAFPFRSQNS